MKTNKHHGCWALPDTTFFAIRLHTHAHWDVMTAKSVHDNYHYVDGIMGLYTRADDCFKQDWLKDAKSTALKRSVEKCVDFESPVVMCNPDYSKTVCRKLATEFEKYLAQGLTIATVIPDNRVYLFTKVIAKYATEFIEIGRVKCREFDENNGEGSPLYPMPKNGPRYDMVYILFQPYPAVLAHEPKIMKREEFENYCLLNGMPESAFKPSSPPSPLDTYLDNCNNKVSAEDAEIFETGE